MANPAAFALTLLAGLVPGVTPPAGSCAVESVTIEWGFKESFRSYISSAIALGSWDTEGDVGYETPVFLFTGGEGFLASNRSTGEIEFEGEFRFEGHQGVLNTALSDPRLRFVGEREAVLVLDVAGDTMDGVSINQDNVEFVTLSWPSSAETLDTEKGVYRVEGAQTVLTASGAKAFGTYPAGEVFDPITFEVEVPAGCLEDSGFMRWWIPAGVIGLGVVGGAAWVLRSLANRSRGPEHQ